MRAAAWSVNRDIGAARLSWERAQKIADALPAEIQAEQEALDAARHWPDGPPLRIADRYAARRPRREVS
jgi:hypothetical protein